MAKNIIDYDGNSVADPPGTYPSGSSSNKPATINLVIRVPGLEKENSPKRKKKAAISKRLEHRRTARRIWEF